MAAARHRKGAAAHRETPGRRRRAGGARVRGYRPRRYRTDPPGAGAHPRERQPVGNNKKSVESMNRMATEPLTGTAAARKVKKAVKLPAGKGLTRTIV